MAIRCLAVLLAISACGRVGFDGLLDGAVPDAPPDATPDGMFLVTANGDGTASVYRVDPITYAIEQTTQGDVTVGSPNVIDATPDGRFIYMPNFTDNTLSGFAIDPHSGALSPIPGTPIAEPAANPQAVLVHPSGKFLYLVNSATLSLLTYAIDATTGELTPVNSVGTATTGAYMPALDPPGRLLYISTYQPMMAGYQIDLVTGTPTAVSGSPFAAQGANMIPTFDRTGQFLYLCANGTELRGYAVDTTGALTEVPGSPYANLDAFFWLKPDPSGAYLIGITGFTSGIFVWSIDPITGALTPVAGSPFASVAEQDLQWGVFTPDGKHFFAGSDYLSLPATDLALYSFDPTTGAVGVVATALAPRTAYVSSMVLVQP